MQERLYLIMYKLKNILLCNVDSKLFELPCSQCYLQRNSDEFTWLF